MAISLRDLEWAAGFIEGEGCFHHPKKTSARTSAQVKVAQVQKWPLKRLLVLFGGSICAVKRQKIQHSQCYAWNLVGVKAVGLMMTLWPLMSPKRRRQIESTLKRWKAIGIGMKYRSECPCGHLYTKENTYVQPGTVNRQCRICRRRQNNLFYARHREQRLEESKIYRKRKQDAA